MPDSPLSASPYEVLGVAPTVSQDELRQAYRRRLRQTHPDTGGSASRFDAVQHAWALVGTPEARAAYDRGRPVKGVDEHPTWAPPAPGAARTRGAGTDTRPRARSHGHPGGLQRERFLTLIREWSDQGKALADPYDPALVRSAPREVRHALADALAEEATARALASLGIGYTIWHDVAVDPRSSGATLPKIDHVVLGPTGLFAVQSEDWGTSVRVHRGDLVGDGVDHAPLHTLTTKARGLGRLTRVRFGVAAIAVPDTAFDESFRVVGSARGMALVVVQSSFLPQLLRIGVAGSPRPDGTELFEVRTRLQQGIRFA
jgi:DnaJ-class molecular chaperone with C-terminal Zn finger domain